MNNEHLKHFISFLNHTLSTEWRRWNSKMQMFAENTQVTEKQLSWSEQELPGLPELDFYEDSTNLIQLVL